MIKIEKIEDMLKYREITGDFTYGELAEVIGCSKQAVKFWFTDRRKPSDIVLQCLGWYVNYCLLQKETDAKLKRIYDYYQQ